MTFVQTQRREFREFRLIEILNECEVKEHLVFVHSFYFNQQQRLYFDSQNKYMIEKLGYPRIFLYEKQESKMRRRIKWRCIKRFNKFPEDLENESGLLRSLSPTFQYFLSVDRSNNQFVVLDTFSMEEVYRIPDHLMDLNQEPAN